MARGYELLASMKAVGPDQLVAITAASPKGFHSLTQYTHAKQHRHAPLPSTGVPCLLRAVALHCSPPGSPMLMASACGRPQPSPLQRHRRHGSHGVACARGLCLHSGGALAVEMGCKFQSQADTWTAAQRHLRPCTTAADPHLRCDPSSHTQLATGLAQSYLHKLGRRLCLSDGTNEHVALCVTCSWHVISCSESGIAKQCQTAAAPKAAAHQQCSVHRAPTCASCWQNRTSCGMAASAGTAPLAHLRLGHQKQ